MPSAFTDASQLDPGAKGWTVRCIFCREPSSSSKSIEHVVPESFGGGDEDNTLAPGIVCDRCNNYFAVKLEGPLSRHDWVQDLRFRQQVSNKRGRINSISGVSTVDGGTHVRLRWERRPHNRLPVPVIVTNDPKFLTKMNDDDLESEIAIGSGASPPTESRLLSRFLAMMAMEFFALQVQDHPGGVESLLHPDLDSLRDYARFDRGDHWPISVRQPHHEQQLWRRGHKVAQFTWRLGVLFIPLGPRACGEATGRWVFIAQWFGTEFAIDVAGRSIVPYREWLWRSGFTSPLAGRGGWTLTAGPQFRASVPGVGSRALVVLYDID